MKNHKIIEGLNKQVDALDENDERVETLKEAAHALSFHNPYNRYDKTDVVRQLSFLQAGSLKLAEYQIRDLETDEWSDSQFHMTMNNTVMGIMSMETARLFVTFIEQSLERKGKENV